MRLKINWDALGITASIACAIHCALLPLFLTSLPLFGINIIDNPRFEFGMIALTFVIGIYSLRHGFKHHHHSYKPFILFTAGIAFLFAKQVWHQWDYYLLPPAVVLIVAAHYINYKYTRACNH